MSIQYVLLPLFVLVVLTIVLMFGMAYHRKRAFDAGLRFQDIALREPVWPPKAAQWAYAYSNQFELPVLFYVLTILVMITRHADFIFVILAWIFVVTRVLQAYVHVTSNNVKFRGLWFFIGAVALIIAWGIFILDILLGLP